MEININNLIFGPNIINAVHPINEVNIYNGVIMS